MQNDISADGRNQELKNFWNDLFLVKPTPDPSWSAKKREAYYAWRALLLLCAGLCMGLALLVLAIGPYSKRVLFANRLPDRRRHRFRIQPGQLL